MSTVLVIGPSGVGKTALAQYAGGKVAGCRALDLDEVVQSRVRYSAGELLPLIGADNFLLICRGCVVELQMGVAPDELMLVAVGAGALESDQAAEWIFRFPTIAVVAAPNQVHARGGARNSARSLREFEATEYSERRQALYRRAMWPLDVTDLSLQDAQAVFAQLVCQIKRI